MLDPSAGNSRDMGRLFSPTTASTQLNKLADNSPEAWDILTQGRGEALDNIRFMANRIKKAESLFNASQTGRTNNLNDIMQSGGMLVV